MTQQEKYEYILDNYHTKTDAEIAQALGYRKTCGVSLLYSWLRKHGFGHIKYRSYVLSEQYNNVNWDMLRERYKASLSPAQ